MPLITKTQPEIRDAMLTAWAGYYRTLNRELDVTDGSDAWKEADAFALAVERIHLMALETSHEVFPDTASESIALKHAAMIGLSKKSPTRARFNILAAGSIGSSWKTTHVLAAADGQTYKPVSSGSLTATTQLILVEAQTSGAVGNQAVGTLLTWQSAPTGMTATAPVDADNSGSITGVDEETTAQLVTRVLRWWYEKPGGANRADFVDWAESISGIDRAFCYPAYHAALGGHTPGGVCVALMGPGGTAVGAGTVDQYRDYFLGTNSSSGGKVPANFDGSGNNFYAQTVTLVPQDVTIEVDGPEFSFNGSFDVDVSGSTNTVVRLKTNPVGTISVGMIVAVQTGGVRGRYELREVTARQTSPNQITVSPPLVTIPVEDNKVRGACAEWQEIADRVFAIFDELGPGDPDTAVYPKSKRWPPPTFQNPYTLYRSAIIAAVAGIPGLEGATSGVEGVVTANVTTPSAEATNPPTIAPVSGTTSFSKLEIGNFVLVPA